MSIKRLPDDPLAIFPLGGLGKIGMNTMLIGTHGRYVMVDAGIGFAPEHAIGAEKMLPDLAFIHAHRDQIEAVVITHGHEDHIGGLPWILPALDKATPVYTSSFTRELIRNRMDEHKAWDEKRFINTSVRSPYDCGPFQAESLRVTHSIPDSTSLFLRSEAGHVLHTGDWRIDEAPMDGEAFDREGFEALGKEGVDLLLSDSTNILSPGRNAPERSAIDRLAHHIHGWPGRVLVSLFSSNLHRIRGLVEIAASTGRQIVVSGRSIWRMLEAAQKDGRSPIDPAHLVDISKSDRLLDSEALYLVTGSQGEHLAALAKASLGTHPHLKLRPGDLLLHSARVIPGNEVAVYDMWNRLADLGVKVITEREIHVSGHAKREELREMMQLTRPKAFVPIHGETTFLHAHAALAEEEGLKTTIIKNGDYLPYRADFLSAKSTHVTLEPYWNDGPATGDALAMRLKERKRVAWNGVVFAHAGVRRDGKGRAEAFDVRVICRALFVGKDGDIEQTLEGLFERVARQCPPHTPWPDVQEAIQMSLRRRLRKMTGKRPEVIVTLHQGRAR